MAKFLRISYFSLAVAGLSLLGACKPEVAHEKAALSPPGKQQDLQQSPSESMSQTKNSEGTERMTSLYQVVSLLVAKNGTPWTSFDAVPGVQWREPSPQPNPDSTSPENSNFRSGTLLLDGFGMVDVPDGNQGLDARVKKSNEGESGLTLNGDAQNVHLIAVKKFYVSPEYADVVKRQLPVTATVRLIAGDCREDMEGGIDTQTKFYNVGLDGHQLFLEAYIDDGEGSRGPGYTTFIFSKVKPDKKIKELQCKEI